MKSYITTVEELKGKPVSELHAIFSKAADAAYADSSNPHERECACLTMENVRHVLKSRKAPPGP